ncbi:hypothetical protein V2J09_021329 [Rumex salicifolius]
MIFLLWNCYGVGKASFVKNIYYLIHFNSIFVLTLFETKIARVKAEDICKRIYLPKFFRIEADGRVEGIWIFWDDDHVKLQIVNPLRHCFWSSLSCDFASITEPVFTSGDFNCIIDNSKREGGSRVLLDNATRIHWPKAFDRHLPNFSEFESTSTPFQIWGCLVDSSIVRLFLVSELA